VFHREDRERLLGELERVQIAEATQQRLDALKHLGKKLGRPQGSKDKHKRPKKVTMNAG
jgi:hypothetical protein